MTSLQLSTSSTARTAVIAAEGALSTARTTVTAAEGALSKARTAEEIELAASQTHLARGGRGGRGG